MIFSPQCPVFRSDDGVLLEQAYFVDFITAPAPNAGAVMKNQPSLVAQTEGVLKERASKLLSLAAHHGCEVLALGAWGRGVFRNDPAMVAGVFRELLEPNGLYWGRFRKVVFAVLDTSRSQRTYQAFLERFAVVFGLVWRHPPSRAERIGCTARRWRMARLQCGNAKTALGTIKVSQDTTINAAARSISGANCANPAVKS